MIDMTKITFIPYAQLTEEQRRQVVTQYRVQPQTAGLYHYGIDQTNPAGAVISLTTGNVAETGGKR